MPLLLAIAFRNLLRHSRRTLLMVSMIGFGLAVFLWLTCIIAGRNKNMIDTVISSKTGHLQIYNPKYLKRHLIQDSFNADLGKMQSILPVGSWYAKRVSLPSIISSGDQSATVILEGIEPETEAKITTIGSLVMKGAAGGKFLENEPSADCPSRQIYIGKQLAEILGAEVGGRIAVITQAADGTLGNDLFFLRGIYDSGSPEIEKTFAYTPLPCAMKIAVMTGVHEVAIRVPDDRVLSSVREKIEALYPELQVTTWRDALPALATMLKLNEAMLVMVSILLFVVIALGIMNTFLMSVFERTREFGVMLAVGTTPLQLMKIILYESALLGIAGSLTGALVGVLLVLHGKHFGFNLHPFLGDQTAVGQFNLDLIIYPVFRLTPFFEAIAVTFVLVFFTGVYPAYRASRFQPVEAIRSL